MTFMTFDVAYFIKENKDLIDANAWDQVYDNALFNLDSDSTGELGKALLDAGIDPLNHLDYIPDYFLSSTNIKSFSIPNTIHLLSEGCFSYCEQLESITIPTSVTQIAQFAFYCCSNLQNIRVEGDLHDLSITAFDQVHPECVIYCKENSLADKYATENNFKVVHI